MDVAVLNDNRRVLVGLEDHSAVLFNAVTGAYEQTFLHEGPVSTVAVDSRNRFALTGSDDNSAVLWQLSDGSPVFKLMHDNPVRFVSLSADGSRAFTISQADQVAIWDTATGQQIHQVHQGRTHAASSGAFSPDGRFLTIGYVNRKVAVFDVTSGAQLRTWSTPTRHPLRATGAAILEVVFDARSNSVLAMTGDGRLLQFNLS